MNNQKLNAARDFLARGWSLYPTLPRTKQPFTQLLPLAPNADGKMVPSWRVFMEQRPTMRDIETWFEIAPQANIALIPGALSQFVALDLDSRAAIEYASKQFGASWPDTPTVRSRRGWHLYFLHPGFPVRGNTGIPDLELRGDGVSITAPPSVHESGHVYKWFTPFSTPLAPLPDWLCKIAEGNHTKRTQEAQRPRGVFSYQARENYGAYMNKVLSSTLQQLSQCAHERNKALNNAALKLGGYVANGMIDEQTVVAALQSTAHAIGLEDKEIMPTIRSGLRKGLSSPKELPKPREYSMRPRQRLVRI